MIDFVSVIIPTYKRSFNTLNKAVESVLSQSYTNFELIIVDDSPKDDLNRIEIQKKIKLINDQRIIYIQHEFNQGACKARNTGIGLAKGEYLAFLDDDDQWLPNKLKAQLTKFTNDQVGLVYCSYYFNEGNKKSLRKVKLQKGFLFKQLLYENFIGSTSGIVVRKSCLSEVGLFDENLPASQDYELYLRVSQKYIIDYIEEPLMIYNLHDEERISDNNSGKLKARIYIYKKYEDSIKKYRKINSEKLLLIALGYSNNGETLLSLKYWFRALFYYPIPTKNMMKTTLKMIL